MLGRAVEPVEQPVSVLGCYPGPAVLDGHRDTVAALADADADDAAVAREPAGIVDQDADQPVYPLWRRADPGRTGAAGGHLDLKFLCSGERAEPVRTRGGDRAHVERLITGLGRSRIEPRQPQQILDDPAQSVALALNAREHSAVLRRLARRAERHARFGTNDAQRRPEFVRRIGRQLKLAPT